MVIVALSDDQVVPVSHPTKPTQENNVKRDKPEKKIEKQYSEPAKTLAIIQSGKRSPSEDLIAEFDSILSTLEQKCPESNKTQISDYLAVTLKTLRENNVNMTPLQIGYAIDNSFSAEMIGVMSCKDVISAFLVLTIR